MVQRAQERIEEHAWDNVTVVRADVAHAPLEPAAYDAAIATFSLSAMADVPGAIENVRRALRPGGRFFVCDLRLIPGGRAAPLLWLLGLAYKALAGWTGCDVLEHLQRTFPSVDLVAPPRPWPPVILAVARTAGTLPAGG